MYICISFTLIYVVMKKIIIAIDGVSSTGKSTMAKDLARELGYTYIDTGAMYRSVTLYAMRHGLFHPDGTVREQELQEQMGNIHISFRLNREAGRPDTFLNGENVENDIRTMEVSAHVSPIAALPFVRKALVGQQQRMGAEKGIVMDGRDIGTCVLPDADVKVYLTASSAVRAKRRYHELKEKGTACDLDEIEKDIIERDYRDMHRENSPLKQADDAVLLDSSDMTLKEVVDTITAMIDKKQGA